VTVTESIFTKFVVARQLFVKGCYISLHENPTDGLEVNAVSHTSGRTDGWTEGRGVHMRRSFYVVKNG
jgi:hypothetical protein